MCRPGGHAVVFEGTGRIVALVFELDGVDARIGGNGRGVEERSIAFADGDDIRLFGEGEHLAEAPDAGDVERLAAQPTLIPESG